MTPMLGYLTPSLTFDFLYRAKINAIYVNRMKMQKMKKKNV